MFAAIAGSLTRSKILAKNKSREKSFINWNKAQKIALIIDGPINKSEIDRFTEGTKKYVEVFYIEPASKQASYANWTCCFKKDKTFLNLPKQTLLSELSHKHFDIAINCSEKNVLFGAAVCSEINAPMKSGFNSFAGELDLVLEKKQGDTLISYLKNMVHYLEMIRTE